MEPLSKNEGYSLRITMNDLVEINISASMFNTQLLKKSGSYYTFRIDKEIAPRAVLDSQDCCIELDGNEQCTGTVSECSEDERYLYLRCKIGQL